MTRQVKEEVGGGRRRRSRRRGSPGVPHLGREVPGLEGAGGGTQCWPQKANYVKLAGLPLPSQNQSVCMGC